MKYLKSIPAKLWVFFKKSNDGVKVAIVFGIAAAVWNVFMYFDTPSKNNKSSHTSSVNVIENQKGTINNHSGPGDINNYNGITLEEHEISLRRQQREISERLKTAHADEIEVLKKENHEIEQRLLNTKDSYQKYIADLKTKLEQLERIRGQIPDQLFEEARTALINSNFKDADEIFKKIQDEAKNPIAAAAEAAYQRSLIAFYDIDYTASLEHAIRSVELAPKNTEYLNNAGLRAGYLKKYEISKGYLDRFLSTLIEKHRTEMHPDVALAFFNLAAWWDDQGQYEKAKPLHEKARYIREEILPEGHQDIGASYYGVGFNLHKLEKYKDAEAWLRKAVKIRKVRSSFETALTYTTLGVNIDEQGKHKDAEFYLKQGLDMILLIRGGYHPYMKFAYFYRVSNLDSQDKYQEAEPLYEDLLNLIAPKPNDKSIMIATTINNLAHNLKGQEKYKEAASRFRESYEMFSKLGRADDPNVKSILKNLREVELRIEENQ